MQLNTLLSPLIKAFLHTEYCYCQYYSIDITLDILGYTLDILGLDILGLDILGLDILGLDILGSMSNQSNFVNISLIRNDHVAEQIMEFIKL